MRELPKSLRICGLCFSVQTCGGVDMTDDNHAGECCFIRQRIRVLDYLHPQAKRNVLWHEVGEAVIATDGLEMDHETMTVAFNRAIEVLDTNPALRRYLWGGK